MVMQNPFALLEIDMLDRLEVTENPLRWNAFSPPHFLKHGDKYFHVCIVVLSRKRFIHVYPFKVAGTTIRRISGCIFAVSARKQESHNWQIKALVAAGYKDSEITALIIASRLKGGDAA